MKIFGVVKSGKSREEIKGILKRMADKFKIQGIKSYLIFKDGAGMGSLSFKGEPKGTISDHENKVFLSFCGKIVGYEKEKKELVKKGYKFRFKDSAAEFILNYYKESGTDFIKKLNGVFLFSLYDGKTKTTIIVNDRYGIKPLYYYNKEGALIFASEVKSIASTNETDKKIDWAAWRDMFTFGYVMGDKTFFKNVYHMPNASIAVFKNGRLKIKTYWKYEDIKLKYGYSEEDLINRGVDAFRICIRRQAKGVKKSRILLSGGYDSRCIASCLKFFTNLKFDTLTSSFHLTGKKDVNLAKEVAKKLSVKNSSVEGCYEIYRKHFIDLLYSTDNLSYEHLWIFTLLSELRKDSPHFDGIGGDIILRGCWTSIQDGLEKDFSPEKFSKIIYNLNHINNKDANKFFKDPYSKVIKPSLESIKENFLKIKNSKYKFGIFILKNRTRNSISLIPNNIVSRKTNSLFPFFDNEFVEFGLSIPPKLKLGSELYYKILKKAFPEVMEIPTTNDSNIGKKIVIKSGWLVKKLLFNYKLIKLFDFFKIDILEFPLFKNLSTLMAFPPDKRDIAYLTELIKKLQIPPQIDKNKLFSELEKYNRSSKNPSAFILPIINFCIWYNFYFLEKSAGDLKSLLK